MQTTETYTIDLTKIAGDGEVNCPKCGMTFSPNDETEELYTILETATKANSLERITLKCNKCRSQINLVGFALLENPTPSAQHKLHSSGI